MDSKAMSSICEIGIDKYCEIINNPNREQVTYEDAVTFFAPYTAEINQITSVCFTALHEIIDTKCKNTTNTFFVGKHAHLFNDKKYSYDLCEMIMDKLNALHTKNNLGKRSNPLGSVDELDVEVEMSFCLKDGENVYVGYDLSVFEDAGSAVLHIIIA